MWAGSARQARDRFSLLSAYFCCNSYGHAAYGCVLMILQSSVPSHVNVGTEAPTASREVLPDTSEAQRGLHAPPSKELRLKGFRV